MAKLTHTEYPICIKIQIYKDFYVDRVIYYRNRLPLFIVEQWRWFFEYLAARVKVKNPRTRVELIICAQELLQGEEYKQKKIKDLLRAKRARLNKLEKEPVEDDLFSIYRNEQQNKIKALQEQINALERGEYDGYIPVTYINEIKNFI